MIRLPTGACRQRTNNESRNQSWVACAHQHSEVSPGQVYPANSLKPLDFRQSDSNPRLRDSFFTDGAVKGHDPVRESS
jgi:hypothetical protein